jgi:8-oxoguanine deaminase
VAALLLCQSANTQHTMVEGQWRIKNGQLVGAELPVLVERHNTLARALLAP